MNAGHRANQPKTTMLRASGRVIPPVPPPRIETPLVGNTDTPSLAAAPLPTAKNPDVYSRSESGVNNVKHFQQFSRLHFIGRWKAEADAELQGWWQDIHSYSCASLRRSNIPNSSSPTSSEATTSSASDKRADQWMQQQIDRMHFEASFFQHVLMNMNHMRGSRSSSSSLAPPPSGQLHPPPRPSTVFMHIDMDAFFCSVVLSKPENAQYRLLPVAIASGQGSSEISSCNYVARRMYGVKAGMWVGSVKTKIEEAREIHRHKGIPYPDEELHILPYDLPMCRKYAYDVYRHILATCPTSLTITVPATLFQQQDSEGGGVCTTSTLDATCAYQQVRIPISFNMEIISVDDTMVTLSSDPSDLQLAISALNAHDGEDADSLPGDSRSARLSALVDDALYRESIAFSSRVRSAVWRSTNGCTASVGIGSSYLLSRLATGFAKPNGICCVAPEVCSSERLQASYATSTDTTTTSINTQHSEGSFPGGVPTTENALCAPPKALLYRQDTFIALAVAAKDLFGVGRQTLQRLVELYYVTQIIEVAADRTSSTSVSMDEVIEVISRGTSKQGSWTLSRASIDNLGILKMHEGVSNVNKATPANGGKQQPSTLRQMRFAPVPTTSGGGGIAEPLVLQKGDSGNASMVDEWDEVACRVATYSHYSLHKQQQSPSNTQYATTLESSSLVPPGISYYSSPTTFERVFDERVDLNITLALHNAFSKSVAHVQTVHEERPGNVHQPPRPAASKWWEGGLPSSSFASVVAVVGVKRERSSTTTPTTSSGIRSHEMYVPPELPTTVRLAQQPCATTNASSSSMCAVDECYDEFLMSCVNNITEADIYGADDNTDSNSNLADKLLCIHIQRLSLKHLREALGRKNGAMMYCFSRGLDLRTIHNSGGISTGPTREMFELLVHHQNHHCQQHGAMMLSSTPQSNHGNTDLTATSIPISVFTPSETLAALEYLQTTLFAASEGSGVSGQARNTPVSHTLPFPEFNINTDLSHVPQPIPTPSCPAIQKVGMHTLLAILRQDVSHVSTSMNYACRPKAPSDLRTIIQQLLMDGFLKMCSRMATSSHKDAGGDDNDGGSSMSSLRGGVLASKYKRWQRELTISSKSDEITSTTASKNEIDHLDRSNPSSLLQKTLKEEGFVVANAIKIEILERQPSYPIHPSKHMGVGRCVTKTITNRIEGCPGVGAATDISGGSGITISARQENKQPTVHYNADVPAGDENEEEDEDHEHHDLARPPPASEQESLSLKDDGVGRSCLFPHESLADTWERHRYDTLQATTVVPIQKWWMMAKQTPPTTTSSDPALTSMGRGPLWLPLLSTREVAYLRGGTTITDTSVSSSLSQLKMHLFTNTIHAILDACLEVLTPSLVTVPSSLVSEGGDAVQIPRSEPGFCIALPDVRGVTVGIQRVRLWSVANPSSSSATRQLSSTHTSVSGIKLPTAGLKAARTRIHDLQSAGSKHDAHTKPPTPKINPRVQSDVVSLAESDDDDDDECVDVTHRASEDSVITAAPTLLGDGATYISDYLTLASLLVGHKQGYVSVYDQNRETILDSFKVALSGVSSTTIQHTDRRHLALVCVVISDELISIWNSAVNRNDSSFSSSVKKILNQRIEELLIPM